MTSVILDAIRLVEEKFNVRTLYACESGSRAWGFDSKDSDYDVRIIYARRPSEYLKLFPLADAFDHRFPDDPRFADLDIGCWDIKKAAELMWKSNPPLTEWLRSPIVYKQEDAITEMLRRAAFQYFDAKKVMYHYLSMARGVWKEIDGHESFKLKKYLYCLRPLAAIRYVEMYNTIPPTQFSKVVDSIDWNEDQVSAVNELIRQKKTEEPKNTTPISVLHDLCSNMIAESVFAADGMKSRASVSEDFLDEIVFKAINM